MKALYSKKTFYIVMLFCLLCFIYRCIYVEEFSGISLEVLDKLDLLSVGNRMIYLDDSLKYEVSLNEERPLLFYHGGAGLNFIEILLSPFSGLFQNSTVFFFIAVNFILALLLLLFSLSAIAPWQILPVLPYLAALSMTVNKEVQTIVFLFVSALALNNRLFFNLTRSHNKRNKTPFYLLLVFLILFVFIPVFLSRPALCIVVFTCFILKALFTIASRQKVKFSLNFKAHTIATFSFAFASLALLIFLLFTSQIFPIIEKYAFAMVGKYTYNLQSVLGLLYSLVAPFPFAFIAFLKALFSDSAVFIFIAFSWVCLAIAALYRFYYLWSPLLYNRFPMALAGQGLFVLSAALIGFKGYEITRQLISVLVPSYLFLCLQLVVFRKQIHGNT